jgi:hypothetical protein
MTNDPANNSVLVYDTETHALVQTLATNGKGGVAGNAQGVRQFGNSIVAAVNNGSNSVSLFERTPQGLALRDVVTTTSAPVSVELTRDHLYVAGATTADSFILAGPRAIKRDGSADLVLAEGTAPPAGSTAQAGVAGGTLLVTLKTDPTPGTVDVISLDAGGAIAGTAKAVAGPKGSLTPFGFSTLRDGTALITLAHSGQVGVFRDGQFAAVVNSGGQAGPCWTTRLGKYVFIVNAGSATISREVPTGENIFIDSIVAASTPTGAPTDADNDGQSLAVLDHANGASHLTFFKLNEFGELSADGAAIDLGVPNANGVALLAGD